MNLSNVFQQSITYVEIFALGIGIYQWSKGRLNKELCLVLGYLFFVVAVELGGLFISEVLDQKYNYWLYNIANFISFNYWFFIFYKILRKSKFLVIGFSFIYSVASIFVWLRYENFFTEIQSLAYILGAILLTILIMIFFIDTLKSDRILTAHQEPFFWISIGLLLYYLTNIPFRIVTNYYTLKGGSDIHDLFILKYVMANCMYLFIAYAFLCRRNQTI